MTKKLIIFDMDGTLVNSSLTIVNAINYVRSHLGFPAMEAKKVLSHVNDPLINPAKFFYYAEAFDKDHERWFSEYYSNNHDKELVLYEGIFSLLLHLKDKGYLLGLATNAYRISTLQSLEYLKIHHFFDAIACYDDVAEGKPAPDMLEKVLQKLNITKEDALFIGDGPRDKMASDRAGIEYIMVDWGFTEHQDAVREVKILEKMLFNV